MHYWPDKCFSPLLFLLFLIKTQPKQDVKLQEVRDLHSSSRKYYSQKQLVKKKRGTFKKSSFLFIKKQKSKTISEFRRDLQ